jgi:hypothetical protein
MIEKVVRKFTSFEEEESDHTYWAGKTPQERLEVLQKMREQVNILKPDYGKAGTRLQRVYRIVIATKNS